MMRDFSVELLWTVAQTDGHSYYTGSRCLTAAGALETKTNRTPLYAPLEKKIAFGLS
jgi:hypothetical protein